MVDLVAFESAADRGLEGNLAALQEAASLYQGDLMPDCADEWIQPDRERLHAARAPGARASGGGARTGSRFRATLSSAADSCSVSIRSMSKRGARLMRCYARQGDRATALHLYQECAALLKKELGVQPSAATRITYREILDLDPSGAGESCACHERPATHWLAANLNGARWSTPGRPPPSGRMRLLVIRGEAGIGEDQTRRRARRFGPVSTAIAVVSARCYAGEARLAYAPIADWLKSDVAARGAHTARTGMDDRCRQIEPGLLAGRPDVAAPEGQLESWQRLRFFEALAQAFRLAAPLILVLDDLQWADGDTIEWLQLLRALERRTRIV